MGDEKQQPALVFAVRAAQLGLLVNASLIVVKLLAGVLGNSYALIADGIESSIDIVSSLIVWGGLQIAARPADQRYPYGHGKAESLAAAAVSLMLIGAGVSIAIVAAREIITPHQAPAPFTLIVAGGVMLVKEALYRRVSVAGKAAGSRAVTADAWHHRSDALTSCATFIGIAVALYGGKGWEAADDWAALLAAVIICINGTFLLFPALQDLMDRMPHGPIISELEVAARAVPGVLDIEKLRVRRLGTELFVDLHVQADPHLTLHEAHVIGGKVRSALREIPPVCDALVHMEPYGEESGQKETHPGSPTSS